MNFEEIKHLILKTLKIEDSEKVNDLAAEIEQVIREKNDLIDDIQAELDDALEG